MKILLAPSEAKREVFGTDSLFKQESKTFWRFRFFANGARERVLGEYDAFLKSASEAELISVLGVKNLSFELLSELQNIWKKPRIQAIKLYDGVAFRALSFSTLSARAQDFIAQNTLIFSNLFGVVLAQELLPFYRLKQGSGWSGFEIRKFHKEFGAEVAEFVGDELLIDLRAEYYHASFESKNVVLRPQFFKNGKKVSHYAKYYRGRFLRALGEMCADSYEGWRESFGTKYKENVTIDDFFKNLRVTDKEALQNDRICEAKGICERISRVLLDDGIKLERIWLQKNVLLANFEIL